MITVRPDMVRRAVRLIGPAPEHRAECDAMVRRAIEESSESSKSIATARWVSTSKAKRKAHNRVAERLRRLQVALKDTNLEQDVRLFASPTGLDDWRKLAEARGAETGKTIQMKAYRKTIAAAQAINLLERFGKRKEISEKKKGSPLCRLAAVLYGNPNADLRYPCRVALRKIQSDTI